MIVSDDVASAADPAESVTGAPSATAPSLNCTVPVGTIPDAVTVAVSVTGLPNAEGLVLVVSAVAVAAGVITSVNKIACGPFCAFVADTGTVAVYVPTASPAGFAVSVMPAGAVPVTIVAVMFLHAT